MSNVNINGSWVSPASYQKARNLAASKAESGNTSARSILGSIRQMVPGLNISTNTEPFGSSGLNNLGIHPNVLRKMENDPEEMVRFKALILDVEEAFRHHDRLSQSQGMNVVARGLIIDADGNTSGWSIVQSANGGPDRRNVVDLNNNDGLSVFERMRLILEELAEKRAEREAEDSSRSWVG